MVRIIIGGIFAASGITALSQGGTSSILTAVILCGLGALLIRSGLTAKKRKEQFEARYAPPQATPVKTYTFKVTGTTHSCMYGAGDRSQLNGISRTGDPVYFQPYEWEGALALAVMSPKYNQDLGVVPADKVEAVDGLLRAYNTDSRVKDVEEYEYKDNEYYACIVQINCYPK